jgi:tetratricopeptide (TPR) repeat protein
MQPLVSIIVRSMARPSLVTALESIGAQDHPRIEAIVVAASGPAHPAPRGSAGAHPVRFVRTERSLPRPMAANAGLDAVTGEWITFLDDDDVLMPNHVSGLVSAQRNAGDAKLIYTTARARFFDGSSETLGQPFALIQLYERNFIHLSMSLFSRDLLTSGCRFDESLDILQDWDFFLQCAQHTRFHFEHRQTFEWRADAGNSGTGAGKNQDDERFGVFRDRIYAKWAVQHDALADRVEADLERAAFFAKNGELALAEATCREVLLYSGNDPFALNLLAMVQRSGGDLAGARETQELACMVRPHDSSLAYNLALICRAQGDAVAARLYCLKAAAGTPKFGLAQRLLAELDA